MRLPGSLVDKQRQAGADGSMLASKGILLDLLQLDLTRFVIYNVEGYCDDVHGHLRGLAHGLLGH
jgi:hypothetical protein